MCAHTQTYTNRHSYTHIHEHAQSHTQTHIHTYVCEHTYIHEYIHSTPASGTMLPASLLPRILSADSLLPADLAVNQVDCLTVFCLLFHGCHRLVTSPLGRGSRSTEKKKKERGKNQPVKRSGQTDSTSLCAYSLRAGLLSVHCGQNQSRSDLSHPQQT